MAVLLAGSLHAANTDTWTGGAGDGSWSNGNNWNLPATPAVGDTLVFTNVTGATTSLTDDDNVSFGGLTFSTSATPYAYSIAAGGAVTTLTLTGALTDQSSNGSVQTFNLGITGTTLTLTGTGGSGLALNNGGTFTGALTDTSNGATADTLAIGAGQTLSFAAANTIGAAAGTVNTTTSLSVTGTVSSVLSLTSSLTVGGNANTGTGTSNIVTANLSGIGTFNLTATSGSLGVATAAQTSATLTLANTSNTINVGSVSVGNFNDTLTGTTEPFGGTLHLGGGTNVFNVGTAATTPGAFLIGSGRNGTVDFAGPGGSVTIAGFNGAVGVNGAKITVGEGRSITTTRPNVTANLSLAGHTANIDASTVIVGLNDTTAFNPGNSTANLTFDTGTFNIQTLQLARETNSHGTMAATFTLGTNSASTGVLNVATEFDILDNTVNDGNAQAGTFIINGGTANLQTSIVVKATGANTASKIASTLTLAGGILNMNGNAIGASGNGAGGDSALVKIVNMPGSGQTFTIKNLGTTTASGGTAVGDGINGAGLTMNGAGTLILDGTNTYGQTTVSTGTLRVGAGSTAGTLGTSAVTDNSILQFNRSDSGFTVSNAISGSGAVQQIGSGTTTLTGANNYAGATTITNGTLVFSGDNVYSGAGAMTVNAGTLRLITTSSTNNISSAASITINSGGTFDLTQVAPVGGFVLGNSQTLFNNGGVATGNVTALNGGTVAGGGGTFNGPSGNNTVTINGGALVPGNLTTVGNMTMSNLAVASSGAWGIKINGASADSIAVSGTASFANDQSLFISQLAKATSASYTVLTAGSLTGLTAGTLQTVGRTTYSIDAPALAANTLKLDVTGSPAALAWTGTGTVPAQWDDTQATANWIRTDGGLGDTTHFYDGDNVTFDDSHNTGNQYNINLSTNVAPGTITVTNGSIATPNTIYVLGSTNGSSISALSLLMSSSNGTGALTINTSNNSFTLGTIVQSGTLNANAAGALGTQAVTVSGGVLNLTAANAVNSSTPTVTINGGALNLNVSGALGNNPINLTSGNLDFGASGAIGSGMLTLGGGTIDNTSGAAITLNNNPQVWNGSFVFQGTNDLDMGTGTVTLNSNPTVTVAAGNLTVDGAIGNGTGNSVTKSGAGTLILTSNASGYSGGTTINAGVVKFTSFGALGTGPVSISGGGTLDLSGLLTANIANGFGTTQVTIAGTGVATLAFPGGEGAIFNNGPSQQNAFQKITLSADATIGGNGAATGNSATGRYDLRGGTPVLDLAGHTLTKAGSSQFTLVSTSVTAGNIVVASPGAVGAVFRNTLGVESASSIPATINPDSTPSTITFNDDTNLELFQLSGAVTRPMVFNGDVLVSTGTTAVSSTLGSPITINGVLRVDSALSGANNNAPIILTGNLSGPGSIIKANSNTGNVTGAAVLTLSGNSSYSGGTTITGGTIVAGSNTALGTGPLNVSSGSTLDLHGFSLTVGPLSGDTGTITSAVAGAVTLTVGNGGGDGSFGGTIQNGSGTVGFTKVGAGTEFLTGSNIYAGATQIQAGTLRLGGFGVLPTATSVSLGSGTGSGILDLAGNNATVASLTSNGTGAANIVGNSGAIASTLTLSAASGSFGGTIQDVLGSGTATTTLTISGGSLTLTGANTYTGGTNINGGGTLTVNGSLASTAPIALNSGTLSGNGSVGNVTMQVGSSIRPGLTAADGVLGNLTMHNLTVNGGDLRVDLAAGNQSDELIVTGAASFLGNSTITPTASSPPPGNYLLLTAAGGVGGTPPTLPAATRTVYTLHFGDATSGPDDITLNVVGAAKSLTWTGNIPPGSPPGDGSTWDVQNNQNWSDNGGTTTDQTFFNQDSVTFPNNSHRAITLNQIVDPGAVTFANDANNPYTLSGSGAIDGLTGLTVSGGGTVTITTTNTYSGTTAVTSGSTLRIADPTVNSGTLGSLGTGPIAVDGTVIFNRSDSLTVPGAISGAGVVQQNGTGTLVLSGASSYTGGTVFNGGTVQVAADNNLGGGAGPLKFNGGTLEATASFATARGTTINAPGGSFNVDSGATLTQSGVITGGGMLFTTGPGTLVLAASNTMTGGVMIDNGILQVGIAGALNSTTPNAVAFPANAPSGAALRLNGINVTISGLNTDPVNPGSAVVDNGSATAATLTVKSAVTNTFGGVMQNTGSANLNLAMTGGGTLLLSGTNSFGGLTTINGSTIQTAVAGNLVGLAGQVNFINGTLHITGDPTNPGAPIVAANTTNKFSNSGNAGATGTFNIDAGVSFQVGATVTQTTAVLQTAGTGPNGSGTAGGSFIKTGLGTMIIYGQNNQQDTNFQLQQGTIDLRSARGLGGEDTNAVRLDMSDGTKLILDADPGFNNVTVPPPAGLTGTDFLTGLRSATAGGTMNITVDQLTAGAANSQAIGALQAAGAFTMNVTSGPNMTSGTAGLFLDQNNNQTGGGFNGAVALSGNGTFNVVTNTAAGASGMLMTINGPVTGTGFGITKTGSGTLQLNSANTYSGATNITGGTLRLSSASVNSIPSSPTFSIGSGATFDVSGLTNGTIVLGSGATAQTLTGSGTLNGSVTVNAGSAFGGASGGTLTITGGASLQDQSHSAFTLGAPNGSGNALTSLVNIAGALAVAGTNLVDLSGAAQAGTYELYAFTSGAPTASQFLVSSSSAGAFNYTFSVIPNQEVDLIATPSASASWNFNGNGNYSESAKWSPTTVPNGTGLTATFGDGVPAGIVAPPPSAVTVTIDGVYTLGTLQFNNSASPTSTQYILGNDAVGFHNITLNNGGLGATVSVAAGVSAQQEILANLLLADNATFNIAGGTSLLVSVGSISQTGGNRSLTLTGGGTLTIDSASSYGGGTTVTNGELTTTATGTLGNGPLAINAADTITSSVNLNSNQNVTSISGTTAGSGTASLNVAAGTTLTVNQASTTIYSGNVSLAPSGAAHGGGTLTKSGAGILEIDGAPSLGTNSNLNVSGGTLRFKVTSGSVFVGTGVLATVTGTATLELAGSESALDPLIIKGRADILNNSTASAGVLVTGTNQQVGGIDGTGTTQVDGGSDLTANHIAQGALVIGGDATHAALVTIDASDSNGNPLASSGGMALAGSLEPREPFGSDTASAASFLASSSSSSGRSLGSAGAALGGAASLGGSLSTVPEPATFVLLSLGSLVCLIPRLRRRLADTR
ncbi:MAG TPA: autotransporter-associated beta strand repeat-containing protein [Pirellulales bacterium]|nr:autotransporter-associated beta strand repeat-containing protein [Pirellulales bacterium]